MTSDNRSVRLLGVRALEGPNLYFPRPAIRVTIDMGGWYSASVQQLDAVVAQLRGRRGGSGEPDSIERCRAVLRLVALVTRRLAAASGTPRLGVRVREGAEAGEVIVSFPWNRLERAKETGRAVADALSGLLEATASLGAGGVESASAEEATSAEAVIQACAERVLALPEESRYTMPKVRVPAIAITGTNGKTTTTRLISHIAMTAGRKTAWSSTEGVLVDGETVLTGDYSGPGGAREVLSTPGLEVAVLETARGGLLNRGMSVPATDVSVVTNVTEDHLGVGGVNTIDQLAEVKSIITKVVKPQGWCVLNGDDPRVWAMRSGTPGRPFAFTLEPHSPAIREAISAHGQAITVREGHIVVIDERGDTDLVALADVPMTLAGLSQHNVANALAGAAGALALGLPREAVVEGLKTFAPDATHNPGRMNVYTLPHAGGKITVVIDMAHNEAGLDALLRVARGLVAPGAQLILGLGTGGDRTDEILTSMGEMAGLGADHVQIVHKEYYLRGRSMENLESFLREGLARVNMVPSASWEDEHQGLAGLLRVAEAGDVVALMTHSHQSEIHDWLIQHGGSMDDAATIARKARAHANDTPEDATIVRNSVTHAIAALRLAAQVPNAPREVTDALAQLLDWEQQG